MIKRIQSFLMAIAILIIGIFTSCSQTQPDPTYRIAFYNVENLFDTIPNPLKEDLDFTPTSKGNWNTEKYFKKLNDLSRVVEAMEYPALIGFAEVENATVLNDLCQTIGQPYYRYLHHESPDNRGIDVALLYQPEYFRPLADLAIPLQIDIDGKDRFTRDILHVTGIFLPTGDTLDLFVNHWPSRRGGLAQSEHRRIAASDTLTNHIHSLKFERQHPYIIIMGDFNDEPSNKSLLQLVDNQRNSGNYELFNIAMADHKKGQGTYNYRGNLNMLDQFIINQHMMDASISGLKFHQFKIFSPSFLLFDHPRFGLSPNRTYGGPNYYGGTSDHLPIYFDFYPLIIDEVED